MLNDDFSRRLAPSPPEVQTHQPQDPEPVAPQQSHETKTTHILLLALFGALLTVLNLWTFYPAPEHAVHPIVPSHVGFTLLGCGAAQLPYMLSYAYSGRLDSSWALWSMICCLIPAGTGYFTRNVGIFVASGLSLPLESLVWLAVYWMSGHED